MDALLYIVNTLVMLLVIAFLLRLLLPLVRADLRNPFGDAVLRLTNPLVLPLRKLLPPVRSFDVASLVALLLVQFAGTFLELITVGEAAYPPPHGPDVFSFGRHVADWQENRGDGFSMLVLSSADAVGDARWFRQAGIGHAEAFAFRREGKRADGSAVEVAFTPSYWVHAALWLPLTLVVALILLQPIKGAIVGLQWALRMHGFNPAEADHDELAPSRVIEPRR